MWEMKCIILISLLLMLTGGISHLFAQNVLVEDMLIAGSHPYIDYLIDTLQEHGAIVYLTSEGEWTNLMNMNALMVWEVHDSFFTQRDMDEIIEFAGNGGKILMLTGSMTGTDTTELINVFLTDSGWETTMGIDGIPYPSGYSFFSTPFPPFTNDLDTLELNGPIQIYCGNNAYPFAFAESDTGFPDAAISYPFAYEGNCSSFLVLVTGTHDMFILYPIERDIRFASNLVLGVAGVPGYELEPGAIPGGGNACEQIPEEYHCTRSPNPFTPNDDEINDYCQFEFDNMGNSEGTIYIYNIYGHEVRQIDIPEGAGAKEAAQWDGRDNNGNPFPQGLYVYVIESGGEVVCEGTVVIAR